MLITPREVHNAQISTRFFGTGYDIEETDQLLDNCEQTIEGRRHALHGTQGGTARHETPT